MRRRFHRSARRVHSGRAFHRRRIGSPLGVSQAQVLRYAFAVPAPAFRNTFSGSGKTAAGRPFLRAKRESICRLPLPQRPGKPPPAFLRASLPRPERAVLEFSFLQFPRKRPYRRKSFSVLFHFCLINVISQGIDVHNGEKVLYRLPEDSIGAQVFVAGQLLLDDASGDQGRRAANGGEINPAVPHNSFYHRGASGALADHALQAEV